MEKIAIIGLGVSGAAVLQAYDKLFEQKKFDIEFHGYELPHRIGKGIPFSETYEQALINSRTTEISFDYENMNHFAEWLKESDYSLEEYSARNLYGIYSEALTTNLINKLKVNLHPMKVRSLIKVNDQWQVTQADGSTEVFDRVHLCCGELPVSDYYHLEGNDQYIHQPFPLDNLKADINEKDTIALIGMGLTSIDVLKYLLLEIHPKKIYIFSNTGYFPTVRGDDHYLSDFKFLTKSNLDLIIEENKGYLPLGELENLVKQELLRHHLFSEEVKVKYLASGVKGLEQSYQNTHQIGLLQSISMQLSTLMTQGWRAMTQSDREIYLKKYHKMLVILRNPIPPSSAELILEALHSEKVELLADVSHIKPSEYDTFSITLENPKYIKTDWVINTTGMTLKNKEQLEKNTLLFDLINHEYLQIDDAGGISINLETGNIISPKYGEISNFHAHGQLIEGVVYQNNSTIKIQKFAERIINEIYNFK